MSQDPDDSVPTDPLPEVSMAELIERAKRLADVHAERGELMLALRARGLSWRQIEAETGIPQANARRWARKTLDDQPPTAT